MKKLVKGVLLFVIIKTLQNCTNPIMLKNGKIVPCGTCLLCRRFNRASWQVRCEHELITCGGKASFITLTYKSKFLNKSGIIPKNEKDCCGNLIIEDVQKFNKRLRKAIKKPLKIVYCGEYGDNETLRPHWHLIVFGVEPKNLPDISKIWGMGRVDVSPINATSNAISYVLGYVSKKAMKKNDKIDDYLKFGKRPPFIRFSKGIGKDWAIRNFNNWSDNLEVATKGGVISVPRYYIKTIKKLEGVTYKVTPKTIVKIKDFETLNFKRNKIKITYTSVDKLIIEEAPRYFLIENVEAPMTFKINSILMKKIKENVKKIEQDLTILKRDDYFEIMKLCKDEEDEAWKSYRIKCENYVNFFNNEKKFVKMKSKEIEIDLDEKLKRFKNPIKREIYKKPKIWLFDEFNFIAKNKVKNLKKGLFGKRNKC